MRLNFYVDVYSWTTPQNAVAFATCPTFPPGEGGKRYRIVAEVPDPEVAAEVVAVVAPSPVPGGQP